ncbi:MAG TPA: sugar transferase [Segeticoccus sp.]|uniref:sugar transferase n=1 Tax=Segeticoccus sp. TaxID=2706531 RepID=UPI002D808ADF|nr:sugar transferase [Segeticoccus sp.]HET8600735.1 sugar transferase [Segeticoccus sp.]
MKKYSDLEAKAGGAASGIDDATSVLSAAFPQRSAVAPDRIRRGERWTLSLGDGTNWLTCYRHRVVLLDLASALLAVAIAVLARFGVAPSAHYVVISLLIALSWLPVVYLTHGYEARYLGVGVEEYRALFRSALVLLTAVGFASFAFKQNVARVYVLVLIPCIFVLSLLMRRQMRRWLFRQRNSGRCQQRTIVVGHPNTAMQLIRELRSSPGHALEVVAMCTSASVGSDELPEEVRDVPVHGSPTRILELVDSSGIDVVAVANDPDLSGYALRQLAWELEERGVDLLISPGIFEVAAPRLSIRSEASALLLHVDRPTTMGAKIALKHVLDKSLAIVLALVALPVLCGLALGVRLTSPGPVFFKQVRVGTRGRYFEMIKFRTMVVDAEAKLAEVAEGGHATNQVLFKRADDPRITRFGAFLRRYSLDELPQLINVIRGDMSLVGPRPPLPREVTLYEQDAFRRLRVQPGMTGLWQVSGRSDLSWEQSLRLDLWYVDNWSPMLDLQILWRTGRAVFAGSGAY